MPNNNQPLNVFITTPLEAEYAEQIRAVDPERVNLIYEPDFFPPLRYVADHRGVEGARKTPEQDQQWLEYLKQADVLWDFPNRLVYGRAGLDIMPNVKWVQTTSSGVGTLIVKLGLQDSDLLVTTARGVHAGPLSEFVMLGVLMHFKRLAYLKQEQKKHSWVRYCGDDLDGKTLAVIGVGEVGQRVAQVVRFMGMRLIGMKALMDEATSSQLGFERMYAPDELHEMLSKADVVVMCVPHTPQTERMIDQAAFAAMKDGVVFVNISRGQTVDEPQLINALQSGKIGSAVLDVAATEPLPEESPLWDMPNVLISPHSASTVASENAKIANIFCHNLRCYLDGNIEGMKNMLNKARMY